MKQKQATLKDIPRDFITMFGGLKVQVSPVQQLPYGIVETDQHDEFRSMRFVVWVPK